MLIIHLVEVGHLSSQKTIRESLMQHWIMNQIDTGDGLSEFIGGVIVVWRICVRRRLHPKNRKTTKRKSSTRYNTQIDSKKEIYKYCKSLEPKSVQESKLNHWEQHLTNLAALMDVTNFSIIVDESSTQVIIKADSATNKRGSKLIAMSSNAQLQKVSDIEC
jgi:hypothetical protein